MSENIGRVGRFQTTDKIGIGGMAEVYLGYPDPPEPNDPQFVAVKRILPAVASQMPEAAKMFLDEAVILSRLQHPNIVRLIDVCSAAGSPCIVMELLDGVDLSKFIKVFAKRGLALPRSFSALVVADIADALAYAYGAKTVDGKPLKLVHRDVSPHNVFVSVDGSVRLLDFGVARAENRLTNTRTGLLKGKLPYMSPEQASGEYLGHESDVFSLGIVLYELTVGYRPFRSNSEFGLLSKIVACDVPWPDADSGFPEPLLAVLRRALQKAPADRYASASEMASALRTYANGVAHLAERTPLALMQKHFPEQLAAAAARQLPVANTATPAIDRIAVVPDLKREATPEQRPIEKTVTDDGVSLVFHQMPTPLSFKRAIDGVEGKVTIDFDTDADFSYVAAAFAQDLRGALPQVALLRLSRVPDALARALEVLAPAEATGMFIASRRRVCPQCSEELIFEGTLDACPKCEFQLGLKPQADAVVRIVEDVAAVAVPPPASHLSQMRHWLVAGLILLLVLLVLWLTRLP